MKEYEKLTPMTDDCLAQTSFYYRKINALQVTTGVN